MRKSIAYPVGMILLLLFIIVINWTTQIKNKKMPHFDEWSRPFVDTVAETNVYTVFRWITEFGSFHFVLPLTIIGVIVFWIIFRDYLPALTFGLGVLSAHLLNKVIKEFIARERPSVSVLLNAEGYSFPSGHSMVTIVCYGLIAYLIGTKLATLQAKSIVWIVFGSLIGLIGFSRYILNVHYLTDIISGFLFGSVVLVVFIYFYKKITQIRLVKKAP